MRRQAVQPGVLQVTHAPSSALLFLPPCLLHYRYSMLTAVRLPHTHLLLLCVAVQALAQRCGCGPAA
jgi:hypothetical protein